MLHQWNFYFFILIPVCAEGYQVTAHITGSGIFRSLHEVLLSNPANGAYWQHALVKAEWQSVVQSALNTHSLCKSLVNCSSWTIGHYPDIDSLFVQDSVKSIWKPSSAVVLGQEASVLAHRVIHSVRCTQRGLSSLVSLLLTFKESVYVHVRAHARMCARVRTRVSMNACMHTVCPCSNTG